MRVDLTVAAEHGLHAHAEGAVAAVVGSEADVGRDLASAQLDQRVERRSEPVAVVGVDTVEPAFDGATEGTAAFAQANRELVGDTDAVALDVPVEDEVARAGEREGTPLDFAERADRHLPFREGVLHRGEAEQHDDEHEAPGDRGLARRRLTPGR